MVVGKYRVDRLLGADRRVRRDLISAVGEMTTDAAGPVLVSAAADGVVLLAANSGVVMTREDDIRAARSPK